MIPLSDPSTPPFRDSATEQLPEAAEALGLAVLGGFRVKPEHGAPEGVASIVMLGLSAGGWSCFAASPEARDTAPDPLDRWSRRVVSALAREFGAWPLFPFGGPPHRPFLRWAEATGRVWASPIGMSIHDERGLWVAFRGALGFARARTFPPSAARRPCETCATKPCLDACPVNAFVGGIYDSAACLAHLSSTAGADCLALGCRARRACPAGRERSPVPDQATFHMRAFARANARDDDR